MITYEYLLKNTITICNQSKQYFEDVSKYRYLAQSLDPSLNVTGVCLQEHRPGVYVFAKWTDCRMYPARVTRVNHNGSYEVLFYDGFRKTVQEMNIRAMPPDIQQEVGGCGALGVGWKLKWNKELCQIIFCLGTVGVTDWCVLPCRYSTFLNHQLF